MVLEHVVGAQGSVFTTTASTCLQLLLFGRLVHHLSLYANAFLTYSILHKLDGLLRLEKIWIII